MQAMDCKMSWIEDWKEFRLRKIRLRVLVKMEWNFKLHNLFAELWLF